MNSVHSEQKVSKDVQYIDRVIYINLDYRIDRREQFEKNSKILTLKLKGLARY